MGANEGSRLRFDRAGGAAAGTAPTCATCQRTIPDVYYEAGGRVLCSVCKAAALAARSDGSELGRLVSTLLFGTLAAAVSAVGWYAITRITGYEIGLVALAVGLFVGAAVRMGAKGRGGWLYQTLAIGLTYLAIAMSNVPFALEDLREQAAQEAALDGAAGDDHPVAEGAAVATDEIPPEALEAILWVSAIAAAFVWPVLQVTEGGFIGLLIVGFALYEAWKINRRQDVAVGGPFRVTGAPAA